MLPAATRAEQNEVESYFSSNNFMTVPYHSAYWIGYQALSWGVNSFRSLDRWEAACCHSPAAAVAPLGIAVRHHYLTTATLFPLQNAVQGGCAHD
jgi:hypothetical protein